MVRRPLARWVAAAAAAGILIGVTGGQVFQNGVVRRTVTAPPARTVLAALPTAAIVTDSPITTAADANEEAVMDEIEEAVFGRGITALSALDEMTPHVRQEAVLARAVR